jgi:hypothetical protein
MADIPKEMSLRLAANAARKAVEFLEMQATGAARAELLKALDYLAKAFQAKS